MKNMTYNEISEFVDVKYPITQSNTRTELKFKNSPSIFGYFDKQTPEQRAKNLWGFVETPQENNNKEVSIINGDEIESIHLHIFGN